MSNQVPGLRSAVMVGSAVNSDFGVVGDIDVSANAFSVAIGEERRYLGSFSGRPLDIVCRHPDYFTAVLANDMLIFYHLRELRKIVDGVVLLDTDRQIEKLLDDLKRINVPLQFVRPLIDSVAFSTVSQSRLEDRISYCLAFDNLIVAWLHLDARYRFRKHKWLVEDTRRVKSDPLNDLVNSVTSELMDVSSVSPLIEDFDLALADCGAYKDIPQAQASVKDARTLLKGRRIPDAIFPARYAALAVLLHFSGGAEGEHGPRLMRGFRSVNRDRPNLAGTIQQLLLLDTPVSAKSVVALERARRELENTWEKLVSYRQSRPNEYVEWRAC
ncbi:hypothetical protein [Mesorhizobium sp. M0244]|uniref:hypothetical protein n=1 Tax=Mesorhizobium sp. M0244 TaxID=2956926 RepID=UPI00333A51B8